MLALWIVLVVVVLAVIVTGAAVIPRRRSRGAGRKSTGAGASGSATIASRAPTATRPPRAEPEESPAPPAPKQAPAPVPDVAPVPEGVAVEVQVEAEAEAKAAEEEEAGVAPPPALRDRMGKTRGLLSGYVRSLRSRGSVDEQTWEDLEEALLRADIGVPTTTALLDDLRARVRKGELKGPDAVVDALRGDLRETLKASAAQPAPADEVAEPSEDQTTEVWLFVGVNGVGKTTTIGKVARRQVAEGRSVVLAAGDTFRAAAAEQLETWAERSGVPIVRGAEGGDPSAVVYDAVRRAAARGDDLVLADTAGRLHTKVNLVEELKKIRRVADRPPGHVTEVMLVLDATTGQNGLAQARQFTEAVGVTGVVLTKLDGTAKGGIVVAIQRELGLPVKLVGIGEGVDDLVVFDPDEFVDALFD